MRQLLVECSEPGLVVTLSEEFEYVLRHVDFERATRLWDELSVLAHKLGGDVDEIWQGFRLETPNQVGCRPVSFSSRETLNPKPIEPLISEASKEGIGSFEVGQTLLLSQSGPRPNTREQYVRDLAAAIKDSGIALGLFGSPVSLPESMASHRERILEEHVFPDLMRQARFPSVGRAWIADTHKRLEDALGEASTRVEAVMDYELRQLNPDDLDPVERVRWSALAVRLEREVEKWYAATAAALPHIHQRAALVWLLWGEGRRSRSTRSFLEEQLGDCMEEAESVYTADGAAALHLVYEDTQEAPLWSLLPGMGGEPSSTGDVDNGE